MIVASKDEKEHRAFDHELNADPKAGPVSRGVGALGALLGGFIAPPPPTFAEAEGTR